MFDSELAAPIHVGAAPRPSGRRFPAVAAAEALCLSPTHSFTKLRAPSLTLLKGLGIEGDAHCGVFDLHLGRRKDDPPPNLRQVHLFPAELVDALAAQGFTIEPGAIGENITVRGLADMCELPLHTVLSFPSGAALKLTGRRTPCKLVDRLGKGLMRRLAGDGAWGERPVAGVMAVVLEGGRVRAGERFTVELPAEPHEPMIGL